MQALIRSTQLLERCFEEGLVLDSLSRTQGHQAAEPHVDADCRWLLCRNGIRHFHLNGDKPPVGCFADACTGHLSREAKLLGQIHPAELGDPDAVITEFKLIIGEIEARLATLFALELWVACTALKERGKSLAQIKKRLVRGILCDLPGPRELLAPDLIELLLEFEGRGFPSRFILPVPLGQRPVPDKSCHSSSFGEVDSLVISGMQTYFVCLDHGV